MCDLVLKFLSRLDKVTPSQDQANVGLVKKFIVICTDVQNTIFPGGHLELIEKIQDVAAVFEQKKMLTDSEADIVKYTTHRLTQQHQKISGESRVTKSRMNFRFIGHQRCGNED